jgi:fructose transport system substrate-binding protein
MKISKFLLSVALAIGLLCGTAFAADPVVVGLITKTDTNPFFVKMKEGAEKEAAALGVKLLTATGKQDGDTAAQIAALENMTAAGAKTIMITANGDAIIPTVKKVQALGVQIIALDTAFEGADALFATDNYKAGVLIGEYAKAAMGNKKPVIATLDLFPGGPSVGFQRHNGFMTGFGLVANGPDSRELSTDPLIVGSADSYGDRAKGQAAMETLLQKNPNINLVYTINEPAAAGAYQALKAAGMEKKVMLVSIDGGAEGVRNVKAGIIAATSQQYPLKMAAMGIDAAVKFAKTGKRESGYTDTGVNLIAKVRMPGIASQDVDWGLENAWGQ